MRSYAQRDIWIALNRPCAHLCVTRWYFVQTVKRTVEIPPLLAAGSVIPVLPEVAEA